MWQLCGRALVVLAGSVLAASFAGELHGVGDSLAVFRPILIFGTIVTCAVVWRWRAAQIVALFSAFVAVQHGVQVIPEAGEKNAPDLVVYQKNMLFLPQDRADLMADIRAANANIVTLQEVSRANEPTLNALQDVYPHQLLCNEHSVGAVAILSKTSLEERDCSDHHGFARAVTTVNGKTVQVFALHLHWPWPFGQREHLLQLVENMAPMVGAPTLVTGEFNMVATGRSIAWVEQATQTERVGPLVRTFDLFGYPLGIDHILASGGTADVSVRPQFGSDHYGIVARVVWEQD